MRIACLVVAASSVASATAGEPVVIEPRVPVRAGYSVIVPQSQPSATLNRTTPTTPGAFVPEPLMVSAPNPRVPAAGSPEEGVVKSESWDVIFVRGIKAGYFHTVVREFEREGQKLLYGVKRAKLTVARFGQVSQQWTEEASVETIDGKVLSTRLSQAVGKDQVLQVLGVVEADKLKVTVSGVANDSTVVSFPEGVVGVAGEVNLFANKKPKSGDVIRYKSYLGGINRVADFTARVYAAEPLAIYEGQAPRAVLRVELTAEKLEGYRHPPATVWLDAKTFDSVRLDSQIPLLGGKVTILRTNRQFAEAPAAKPPELNETQSIPLAMVVPDIHRRESVTYRVTLPELPPGEAFKLDSRQEAGPDQQGTFDLTVTARRGAKLAPRGRREARRRRVFGQVVFPGLGHTRSASPRAASPDGDASRRDRLAKSARYRSLCAPLDESLRLQSGNGDMFIGREVADRRLHRVCNAGGRDVPRGRHPLAYRARVDLRVDTRWQSGLGISHVV